MSEPNNTQTDWRAFVTDDLKADPVVSGWAEKATEKDIPSLIKGYAHAQKQLGGAVKLPGKDAKPEEVETFKGKLYEMGLFRKPPGSPDEYKITKPENLPAGIGWNDDLAKELATTLHKHGVPPDAVPDLLALQQKAMAGTAAELSFDKETTLAKLKAEHGEQFGPRLEAAERMLKGLTTYDEKTQAFFDQTQLGNHPVLLSLLMNLAPLAMQDSAFMDKLAVAEHEATTPQQASEELGKIMTDPEHPLHKGWKAGDPEVQRKIDAMYRKAYATVSA